MLEKKFFFGVNFIAALFLVGYCYVITGQSTVSNISMFYLFSVLGSYAGDKYLSRGIKTKLNQNRFFHLVTGVLFPLVMSGVIIYLSNYPLKSTFGRLVVFTVLFIVGLGILIYLSQRRIVSSRGSTS